MQREKKRTVEVAKLNADLKKPSAQMISNKKDRKLLANQVLCSHYSISMKTRMQRTEELKLLLSIEEDPMKKKALILRLKTFLEYELPPIDLCDTSSDEEDDSLIPMSAVTQSSADEPSPRAKKLRLPGRIEKWNDDADSDEGEAGPGEKRNEVPDESASERDDEDDEPDHDHDYESNNGEYMDTIVEDNGEDDQTHYSSECSVEKWGTDSFENPDDNFTTLSEKVYQPPTKQKKNTIKVSSYCAVNKMPTDNNQYSQDNVFTASSEPIMSQSSRPMTRTKTVQDSQESYSASSMLSNTAPTVVATQIVVGKTLPSLKRSATASSSSRSAFPSSSKSRYVLDPPPSTSKIITRRTQNVVNDDDDNDDNDIDIYASFQKNKKKTKTRK